MTGAIGRGTVLKGRYRLERVLGRGGMAAVWLGDDQVLDRPVAIKVISDTLASDAAFLARFRREARIAAGLSHPNLVGVYDFAVAEERPYLVMEFIPGDDLATHISRHSRIDCWRLAAELLDAVAHIHAAGILHRDIKPQNIVLAPDGTARLIDFGIALPRDATALTQTGLVLGSQRFAAPEVMEGSPASERSDLYSCGAVLRSCLGDEHSELAALADRLASPDPGRRPASARQALAQLERMGTAGQATQAFSPTFARPHPPTTSRRVRWAVVAALLGVLAALAIVVLIPGEEEGRKSHSAVAASGESTAGSPAPAKTDAGAPPADDGKVEPETPQTTLPPTPAGDDPALGSALNQEGFEAIQAGRYEEAVPVLEEAVRAFPPGTESLDYAYALFNLGNALRLSGRAEDAVPVLERRLEIPNQTEVVLRELEAARSEAG